MTFRLNFRFLCYGMFASRPVKGSSLCPRILTWKEGHFRETFICLFPPHWEKGQIGFQKMNCIPLALPTLTPHPSGLCWILNAGAEAVWSLRENEKIPPGKQSLCSLSLQCSNFTLSFYF